MTQATARTQSEAFTEFQHEYLMTNETEGALLNDQNDQFLDMNTKFHDDGSELSHHYSASGSKISEQIMESKSRKKSVVHNTGLSNNFNSPNTNTFKDSMGYSPEYDKYDSESTGFGIPKMDTFTTDTNRWSVESNVNDDKVDFSWKGIRPGREKRYSIAIIREESLT
jgi:hypothetical protein